MGSALARYVLMMALNAVRMLWEVPCTHPAANALCNHPGIILHLYNILHL